MLEPGQPTRREEIDFVPIDFPEELTNGHYTALLQAWVTGTEDWVELLRFDFTIPENFSLSSERISRYMYWQRFVVTNAVGPIR